MNNSNIDYPHYVLMYKWNMICMMIRWGLIRRRTTWDEMDELFEMDPFYVPL